MSYFNVESSVRGHKKFLRAGPAASWLWICGMGYCQEGCTDGFIPEEQLPFLGVLDAGPLAERLVDVRLWDRVDGGWKVHDYEDHNRTSAEIEEIRAKKRSAGVAGGVQSGKARRRPKEQQGHPDQPGEDQPEPDGPGENTPATPEADASTTTEAPASPSVKHAGNPTTTTTTATTTTTTPSVSVPRERRTALVQRRRPDAAFEFGRLYVPQRAHTDLLAIGNHDGGEPALLAWYERVSQDWTEGAHQTQRVDPDMIRFWKARYAEAWPPTPVGAPAAARPGALPTYRGWDCPHSEPCTDRGWCDQRKLLPDKYPLRETVPAEAVV